MLEPTILTANTFYWTAAGAASSRRANEDRRQREVMQYLEWLGMDTSRAGGKVYGEIKFQGATVQVHFTYQESCKNVYKSLEIYHGVKRSNITLLRKIRRSVEAGLSSPA